ncbi:hypothetical protein I2493_19495 [Budviciaceae bacterium CWB-B43]|uniref:Uncharacterized protein n=1 Tax=Limnobaculum xujianqingii TaxID=2738837 RepID=A0ABS1IK31_9GAMM|nr:hypothetical protein [Limnobaculum xujianqingii]
MITSVNTLVMRQPAPIPAMVFGTQFTLVQGIYIFASLPHPKVFALASHNGGRGLDC